MLSGSPSPFAGGPRASNDDLKAVLSKLSSKRDVRTMQAAAKAFLPTVVSHHDPTDGLMVLWNQLQLVPDIFYIYCQRPILGEL